jgi:putative transposase
MIRTHKLPCKLETAVADALNLESGRIYTAVLVEHWRIMRHTGHWLSPFGEQRYNDFLEADKPKLLHSHSVDAAQQAFAKASKTAKAAKKLNPKVRYPHWTKKFRTTIWKGLNGSKKDGTPISNFRRRADCLLLPFARGINPIVVELPELLRGLPVEAFLEVRLVFDKRARLYVWHIVVENGKQPKIPDSNNTVSVDLGEMHPAVVGDEQASKIILCRERRHEVLGHHKRLATFASALSREKKGSKGYRKLVQSRSRMKAKHKRVISDIEHKVSRAIVDVAVERQASTIVIGDIKNIANEVDLGKKTNQKISGWNHGKVRQLVEYKAEAEGIAVVLVDERYTSQTCPNCGERHKPQGRVYCCPACAFQSHRDVVEQINILSKFKQGKPGKLAIPSVIKHRLPFDIRLKRSCRDTGQGVPRSVARGPLPREAAGL